MYNDRTILKVTLPKGKLRIYRIHNKEPRYRVEIKAPKSNWGRIEFEDCRDATRSLPKATKLVIEMEKALRTSDLILKRYTS